MARRHSTLGRVVALAAVAAAAGGAALLASQRRWQVDDDPCGPEGLQLPEGEAVRVTTDDGARLEVLVAGPADGPVVVLPHCWGGSRAIWAAVARRLVTSGHRVVLYDQRGHGTSVMGSDRPTIDRLGADLRAVVEHLEVNDAVLAGHSMGGMTIQAFAIEHPEVFAARVRAIVLVATSAKPIPRPVLAPVAERVLGDALLRPWSNNAIGLAMTRGAVGRRPHRAHVVATRDAFFGTSGAARAGLFVGMSEMDYRAGLATIGVPATVLVGSRDRLTPPVTARVLADGIPGAELVVLPDAGHMLPLEEPDRVAAAIAAHTGVPVPTAP